MVHWRCCHNFFGNGVPFSNYSWKIQEYTGHLKYTARHFSEMECFFVALIITSWVCSVRLKFSFRKTVNSKFRNTEKLISFVFEGANMSFNSEKMTASIFVTLTYDNRVNSGNKIPFPKTFCNVNFQLKHLYRRNCTL